MIPGGLSIVSVTDGGEVRRVNDSTISEMVCAHVFMRLLRMFGNEPILDAAED